MSILDNFLKTFDLNCDKTCIKTYVDRCLLGTLVDDWWKLVSDKGVSMCLSFQVEWRASQGDTRDDQWSLDWGEC